MKGVGSMAKMTKVQKKRAAIAMLQKAERLCMNEALSINDLGKVMSIKQKVLKSLGYDPKDR